MHVTAAVNTQNEVKLSVKTYIENMEGHLRLFEATHDYISSKGWKCTVPNV